MHRNPGSRMRLMRGTCHEISVTAILPARLSPSVVSRSRTIEAGEFRKVQ